MRTYGETTPLKNKWEVITGILSVGHNWMNPTTTQVQGARPPGRWGWALIRWKHINPSGVCPTNAWQHHSELVKLAPAHKEPSNRIPFHHLLGHSHPLGQATQKSREYRILGKLCQRKRLTSLVPGYHQFYITWRFTLFQTLSLSWS